MLKKLFIATLTLGVSINTLADNWVQANKIGSQSQGYHYARCFYETSSYSSYPNYRFAITIEGGEYNCPYGVKYNPLTGEWKK